MVRMVLLGLLLLGSSLALDNSYLPGNYGSTEADAQRFINDFNSTAELILYKSVEASWTYNTNLTEHNSQLQVSRPEIDLS